MADPSKEHWNIVKRILRYIKGTSDVALCYGGLDFVVVRGYVDSDYAGDLDKRNLLVARGKEFGHAEDSH